MVVNLCRRAKLANQLIESSFQHTSILDIAGVIESDNPKILRLSDVDPNGRLEDEAIKDYIDFIGSLANASIDGYPIKKFAIYGNPIYWFTPLAEKHDSFHWGKNLWVLFTLLKHRPDLFDTECVVIISESNHKIQNLIIDSFKSENKITVKIVNAGFESDKSSQFDFLVRQIKFFIRAVSFNRQIRKISGSKLQTTKRNLFILRITGKPSIKNDQDLGFIFQESTKHTESASIPFFYGADFDKYNWQETDQDFINSFPTFRQLFSILIQQIGIINKFKKYKKGVVDIGKHVISFELLREELLLGSEYVYYLNFVWLSNYAKGLKSSTRIFYSDEFYLSGRIISSAFRSVDNSNISTYGVQHGLLLENHTVYKITDKELGDNYRNSKNLLIPDFFIVWGKYFQKLFLSSNSLPDNYCLVAGNLKYISLPKVGKIPVSRNEKRKILWCTTLPNYFKAEYKVIGAALRELEDYLLTFRLHPLKHITKEEILEWVDQEILNASVFSTEEDIFSDIAKHDIVISTIFSATFFDALIMGKKSCRVLTGIVKADFTNMAIKNLYNIKTPAEFKAMLTDDKDSLHENVQIKIDSLCYTDEDVWIKTLAHD